MSKVYWCSGCTVIYTCQPTSITVGKDVDRGSMFFLADLRIRESEERIALLETKNKELLKIIAFYMFLSCVYTSFLVYIYYKDDRNNRKNGRL